MPVQTKKHWQLRLHDIVYESNTVAGKAFDVTLLVLIFASILVVMLDSVEEWHSRYGHVFSILEWIVTILFTIEYILRLICIKKPLSYVTSFLGIIDLLAIIPSYLSVFFAGAISLLVFRSLRLLRVFRIFKLTHFISEMQFLGSALRASLKKIAIFMAIVLMLVIILGSIMYLVEGRSKWLYVYSAKYLLGYCYHYHSRLWRYIAGNTCRQAGTSVVMLLGYGIIAVPTGIVTNEMVNAARNKKLHTEACTVCGRESYDADAQYCKYCGAKL